MRAIALMILGLMALYSPAAGDEGLEEDVEPCQETAFAPDNHALYLEAEHAMFERREPERAAAILEVLAGRGLSCYEHYPVTMLRTHAEIARIDRAYFYGQDHAPPRPMPIFDITNHIIPYPEEAASAETEGDCLVRFDATREGAARKVKASCSQPVFVSAAEAHVRKARFEPALENGKPVVVRGALLRFAFRLDPQDAEDVSGYDRVVTRRP